MQMKINQIFSDDIGPFYKKGVISWKNNPKNKKGVKKLHFEELQYFLHFTEISDRCENAEKLKMHFGKLWNSCRFAEMHPLQGDNPEWENLPIFDRSPTGIPQDRKTVPQTEMGKNNLCLLTNIV